MSKPTHQITKKKKNKRMFDYLLNAVDKVFYQVYDGEPVRRDRANSLENILEEEVIFCKNNVCINVKNPTDNNLTDEIAGYMNMKKIYKSNCEHADLILSWVPNKLLSAGSMEEAEIMLPPMPSEQINPIIEPSKYSSETVIPPEDGQTEQASKEDLNVPEVMKDFESPLGNVFGINIIDMKTVKLFYSSLPQTDDGQFVIGSPDNEYKVFSFKNGGLNKLAAIFDTWNGCLVDADLLPEEVGQKVYYIKGKQNVSSGSINDLPVEEGRFKPLNMHNWMSFMNSLGQIEDSFNFRKHVFYAGLSHEVRSDAWKFLLYYHPFHSTRKERDQLKGEKTKAYQIIHNKRLALSGEAYDKFWKSVQFTVDKDVVRTDRSHPYYAGQDNPNIQKMRNILLNYAVFNPSMGYSQGMSDLVAPVLATLHDEVDCFWCFVGLMESSLFATTPRDDSMDTSLGFLRELLRVMNPDFYIHYLCTDEDLNLLFAHRWLVLCFKREFIFHEVLKIWEACWSRYQTDYFHIFICVAMVSVYGGVCLEKKMDSVEILQYFTEMANKFDGSAVLKESRLLLHKFRQFNKIPCTLRGLLSYKGVWDGGILPDIECVSHFRRCCKESLKENEEGDKVDGMDDNKSGTVHSDLPAHDVDIVSDESVKDDGISGENNGILVGNVDENVKDCIKETVNNDDTFPITNDEETMKDANEIPRNDRGESGTGDSVATGEIVGENNVKLSVDDNKEIVKNDDELPRNKHEDDSMEFSDVEKTDQNDDKPVASNNEEIVKNDNENNKNDSNDEIIEANDVIIEANDEIVKNEDGEIPRNDREEDNVIETTVDNVDDAIIKNDGSLAGNDEEIFKEA